ncbi:MAG: FAD-dependent oxidoreductase [Planctomycetes bacterium]|nr:FAD-dependent oxidoreductase [Planctomycetota bacterium]
MESSITTPGTSSFDLVVIGATPSGISASLRAARDGLRVLLTQHDGHIGGMCINGLGQWDALSDHRRCPIFREILCHLEDERRGGDDAGQPVYDHSRHPVGSFSSRSINRIFEKLVAGESSITVLRNRIPVAVEVDNRRIVAVTIASKDSTERHDVRATTFVDATYEGDLLALAGVEFHIGREGRCEFGEPHAGRIFTGAAEPMPQASGSAGAQLRPYGLSMSLSHPDSPGTGDGAIQAYNLRPTLTDDPTRRILPDTPPPDYDRTRYVTYTRIYLPAGGGIDRTSTCNAVILPGENHAYPQADWTTREAITRRHRDFLLGWMFFLQNDSELTMSQRDANRLWGLDAREWTDNGHLPYEMYVREARRMRGRTILTEHDFATREDDPRPKAFADSICFTDWYMDSHSCTRDGTYGPAWDCRPDGYRYDGKLIITASYRPGMIPYAAMLPRGIDNLLVSVCISTTHVAWGSVRLEPCWIHLGEVAGCAASLAHRSGIAVAALSVPALQQRLLADGASIAFFNDAEHLLHQPRRAEWEMRACHGDITGFDAPIPPSEGRRHPTTPASD